MSRTGQFTRRRFLGAAAATLAAPLFVPARAFGANERVVTAHVGVGGQGLSNLNGFMKNAAAVCDVDQKHLAAAVAAADKKGVKVEAFRDYRKVLERKDIDAVVVSTPDHWHGLVTIHACQAGKDVYCEKPLSLTVREGRLMVQAARDHKRIVQTGSQQRSAKEFRLACELVRSGRIGKVEKVLVGIPASNYTGGIVADGDPPAELDYDFWLGPAPKRPYNVNRVHYKFRFFWDYSGGQMTNWGAHHIDIAQWGLGREDGGPVSVEGTATFPEDKSYEVTKTCRLTYIYADGVVLIVAQGDREVPGGTTFIGSKGKIHVNRGKLESTPAEIIKEPLTKDDTHLYESGSHHGNFVECVKSRKVPICDVEIGHRSATVCHLGNIAARLGRKLTWDPVKEAILGDEEATKMLSRPYRKPYVL
jgi:predicted dehydrogenase